jgi:hypothetical protein
MPTTFLLGADGMDLPHPPVDVDVILGYAGLEGGEQGPSRVWTPADWDGARDLADYLVPIVVVGEGRDPTDAALEAKEAFRALGVPSGCIVVLDREAKRDDLTAAWCETFRVEVGRFTLPSDVWYRLMGYTSGGYESVFEGWSYRWNANPTGISPTELGGFQGVQYSWKPGYDLSVFNRALEPYLWRSHPLPVTKPAPKPEPKPEAAPVVATIPTMSRSGPFVAVAVKPEQTGPHPTVVPGAGFVVWPSGGKTPIATRASMATLLHLLGQQGGYAPLDCQTLADI